MTSIGSTQALPWLTRAAQRWHATHTFTATDLPDAAVVADRKRALGSRVSVVLPALNEADTIGDICSCITRELMNRIELVDELLVVDGGSTDETASLARLAGARVLDVATLIPEVPVAPGKGESLWRSLAAVSGDIVVWIDADIRNFDPRFVTRLVAPLVSSPDTVFVKAFYRRPLAHAGVLAPGGGGRVTELLARPLLNTLFPELGGFLQPLSGEYAGRRDVLEKVPFFTGYGVEAGLLIDLLGHAGLDALVQVDLDERVHRNRPLDELSPMAYAIAQTIMRRAEEHGRIRAAIDYPASPLLLPDGDTGLDARVMTQIERPPIELVPTYLEAVRGEEALAFAH